MSDVLLAVMKVNCLELAAELVLTLAAILMTLADLSGTYGQKQQN